MSLLRLLTTGNSLVGAKSNASRYRLTRQRLLPQFGPARNLFSLKGAAAPAKTEARPLESSGAYATSAVRSGIPSSCGKPVAAFPSDVKGRIVSNSASGQDRKERLRLKVVALLSECGAMVSGLLGRPWEKTANPAATRLMRLPVQSELSLDKIKVVRNDLSDADLEIVTARQAAAIPDRRPRSECGSGDSQSTCGRVAPRMFGAGEAQPDEDR